MSNSFINCSADAPDAPLPSSADVGVVGSGDVIIVVAVEEGLWGRGVPWLGGDGNDIEAMTVEGTRATPGTGAGDTIVASTIARVGPEAVAEVGVEAGAGAEMDIGDGAIGPCDDGNVVVAIVVVVAVVVVVVVVAGAMSARLTSPRNSITNDLLPALIFSAPVKAPLVSTPGAKATTMAP